MAPQANSFKAIFHDRGLIHDNRNVATAKTEKTRGGGQTATDLLNDINPTKSGTTRAAQAKAVDSNAPVTASSNNATKTDATSGSQANHSSQNVGDAKTVDSKATPSQPHQAAKQPENGHEMSTELPPKVQGNTHVAEVPRTEVDKASPHTPEHVAEQGNQFAFAQTASSQELKPGNSSTSTIVRHEGHPNLVPQTRIQQTAVVASLDNPHRPTKTDYVLPVRTIQQQAEPAKPMIPSLSTKPVKALIARLEPLPSELRIDRHEVHRGTRDACGPSRCSLERDVRVAKAEHDASEKHDEVKSLTAKRSDDDEPVAVKRADEVIADRKPIGTERIGEVPVQNNGSEIRIGEHRDTQVFSGDKKMIGPERIDARMESGHAQGEAMPGRVRIEDAVVRNDDTRTPFNVLIQDRTRAISQAADRAFENLMERMQKPEIREFLEKRPFTVFENLKNAEVRECVVRVLGMVQERILPASLSDGMKTVVRLANDIGRDTLASLIVRVEKTPRGMAPQFHDFEPRAKFRFATMVRNIVKELTTPREKKVETAIANLVRAARKALDEHLVPKRGGMNAARTDGEKRIGTVGVKRPGLVERPERKMGGIHAAPTLSGKRTESFQNSGEGTVRIPVEPVRVLEPRTNNLCAHCGGVNGDGAVACVVCKRKMKSRTAKRRAGFRPPLPYLDGPRSVGARVKEPRRATSAIS